MTFIIGERRVSCFSLLDTRQISYSENANHQLAWLLSPPKDEVIPTFEKENVIHTGISALVYVPVERIKFRVPCSPRALILLILTSQPVRFPHLVSRGLCLPRWRFQSSADFDSGRSERSEVISSLVSWRIFVVAVLVVSYFIHGVNIYCRLSVWNARGRRAGTQCVLTILWCRILWLDTAKTMSPALLPVSTKLARLLLYWTG